MKKVLNYLNQLVSTASPDNYSNVSFNSYLRELATISDKILEEREELKTIILAMSDGPEKQKLLEKIL
jgi:hypothetical protein